MEENRLRVFANRVLRKTFGPKREEIIGGWRQTMLSSRAYCGSHSYLAGHTVTHIDCYQAGHIVTHLGCYQAGRTVTHIDCYQAGHIVTHTGCYQVGHTVTHTVIKQGTL
jgi:hypothetical protein